HELFALGMANIAGGFFQAYPAGGGTSQTAVNANAGAKTQIAELVTVAVTALILLFLAPLISLMPEATLGALVLVAAAGLVQIGEFRDMAQIRRTELMWALLAFAGVIVFGILQGILFAILLTLFTLLVEVDHPPVYVLGRKPHSHIYRQLADHAQDETFPGLLIVRTEGRLFFANISRVLDKLWAIIHQNDAPQVLLLDCDAIPDIEYTALKSLTEFEEQLQKAGIVLWLTTLNPKALYMIEHSSLGEKLGDDRMYPNLEKAVEAYEEK
ncbi:MAG: STAS domain-containing protein, partial [Anaerolineae bacterium]|nr:STAS domain-containing protein [Anaerolineae bacterium]